MSSLFSIVSPAAAENLISNPSCETATTGWSVVGAATIAQTDNQSAFGLYSLQVDPVSSDDGAQYSIVLATTTTYYLSVWVWTAAARSVTLRARDATPSNKLSSTHTLAVGWNRITGTFTTAANTSFTVGVLTNDASGALFFLDGLQVELTQLTDYVDGDRVGCVWNGTAHASTSTRSSQYRLNGQEINFDVYDAKIVTATGLGLTPIKGQSELGQPDPRSIQLLVHMQGASVAALHALRKALVDVMQPSQIESRQPFALRYSGAGQSVEITCEYEAGLELNFTARGQGRYGEFLLLRLICRDPYWRDLHETAHVLDIKNSGTANYVVGQVDGLWSMLGPPAAASAPATPTIYAIVVGPDRNVYVGGDFENLDGTAACDFIAKYTPSTGLWAALGTGLNGICHALAFDSNGNLWAGGRFTSAGGVANTNKVAYWTGSAWTSPDGSTGPAGGAAIIWAIATNQAGTVYIGGDFTTISGNARKRVASYTGSAWAALDDGVDDGAVRALAVGINGTLYVGGSFTTVDGVAVAAIGVATWSTTGVWASIGNLGGSQTALALAVNPRDGRVYVGGAFTSAGGVTVSNVAVFNGQSFSPLGAGTNSTVHSLAVHPITRMVYAGGVFTSAGSASLADRVARWNGWIWTQLDIDLPGSPNVYALHVSRFGRVYLGMDTAGTATFADDTTVTYTGTQPVAPRLVLKRLSLAATLQSLANATTGQEALFNLPLAAGETVTVDLATDQVYSTQYGPRPGTLLEGSGSFVLQPGVNLIAGLATGTMPLAYLVYYKLYSSVDAAV